MSVLGKSLTRPCRSNIQRIDTRQPDAQAAIAQLRAKLAPSGNVVSEAGRQKTVEVFGTPLAPTEVVERICSDVRTHGLDAVLRLHGQARRRAALGRRRCACRPTSWPRPTPQAAPTFLETIRRIRDNILRFQTAILHRDVQIETPHGG